MKVAAILQNQWFKNVESAKRCYRAEPNLRNRLIRAHLFMGCVTGKRIKNAFGQEWIEQIVWENASPEIAGESCKSFPFDFNHIEQFLLKERPDVILTFGKIATEGFNSIENLNAKVISGPHPAARTDVMPALREMRRQLEEVKKMITIKEIIALIKNNNLKNAKFIPGGTGNVPIIVKDGVALFKQTCISDSNLTELTEQEIEDIDNENIYYTEEVFDELKDLTDTCEEIDAIAFLLERGYGFDQYGLLNCYQANQLFYVNFGTYEEFNTNKQHENEFKTSKEAAELFVAKREELKI